MEDYIRQLVFILRGFAYVSMVLALLHAVHDFRAGQNVTKYIVYLLCLTAFLSFYDIILDYGCQMFNQGVSEARQNTFAVLDDVDNGISQKSRSAGGLMGKYILIPLTKGMLTGCRFFHWISGMIQEMFKVIYRICAPLAIGLAAWRVFISTGIRFAAGTLWLCAWSIGCAITDLLLLKLLIAILAKSILTGTDGVAGAVATKAVVAGAVKTTAVAITTASLWAVLFGLLIFLITAIMLYILMPIALYHIICAGDVVQGATHAMTGAIGGGMAMNNAIGRTFARGGSGGGTTSGGGGNPAVHASNTTGGSSGGSGNTRANRSHAALAQAAERLLENKKV